MGLCIAVGEDIAASLPVPLPSLPAALAAAEEEDDGEVGSS